MSKFRKLNNQPLKFVLAEFRFSEILKIEEYVPLLQEAWRKQYPLTVEKVENAVSILGPSNFELKAAKRWAFVSADKTNAIEIDTHRLVFYTSAYPRFEGFSERCKQALHTLKEIADPALILRIGLRYSDLIHVEKEESIEQLVQPQFAFPGELSGIGTPKQRAQDLYYETDAGLLVIRMIYGDHGLSYMPDIQALPVAIDVDNQISLRMVLDFDHIWNAQEATEFSVQTISENLGKLHDKSRDAFWNITTDYARDIKWS